MPPEVPTFAIYGLEDIRFDSKAPYNNSGSYAAIYRGSLTKSDFAVALKNPRWGTATGGPTVG